MPANFALSLDLDGTLVDDHHLEQTVALAQSAAAASQRSVPYDRVAAEHALDDYLSRPRDDDAGLDRFLAKFFTRFANVEAASAPSAVRAYREAVVASAASFVAPLVGARETIGEIERCAIPYAILTNGWSPLQEEKARLLGVRAPVFVSERIGARKPAPRAFAAVREHFGLPFERIIHVGDDPTADCGGARSVGMQAVWFDRRGATYPSDVAAAHHVVDSHVALRAFLRANTLGESLA